VRERVTSLRQVCKVGLIAIGVHLLILFDPTGSGLIRTLGRSRSSSFSTEKLIGIYLVFQEDVEVFLRLLFKDDEEAQLEIYKNLKAFARI